MTIFAHQGCTEVANRLEVPVILCDEWTAAQVKAFRLIVIRSVTWAQWDDKLLALELRNLNRFAEKFPIESYGPGASAGPRLVRDS